jgi:ABC-type glycerol-3-phosphate transport system substrate-binding protein
MNQSMKKMFACVLVLLLFVTLAGCGTAGKTTAGLKGAYDNEILTTKAVDQDKTMITIRIENSCAESTDLEAVLEQKFPDVDFVLVHDGSINSEYNIRADLVNGTECDFIFSRRLNNVDDIAADYLLDLSAEPFVNNYYISAVDSCVTSDGGLYYLPGPSNVYGIVYDKTMFDQNGWELPHSYSEFVALLETIEEAAVPVSYTDYDGNTVETTVKPIQLSMMYPDMFQIMFNTYGYDSVIRGTDNFKWLSDYQTGNGSMVGHMEPAVEIFEKLFADGILSVDDWDVQPAVRSEMMYTYHSTAMIIECQNAVNYAKTYAENNENAEYHEVAMMPFWTSDEEGSDYVYSIPSYFMAINRKSAEESEEKKELLLDVFEYLSTAEGQEEALIGDSPQMSSIQGVDMDQTTFGDAIRDTVESGQVISTFYYAQNEDSKQVEKQMRSTTPDMISGDITVEEWLLGADQVRDDFLAGNLSEETVYGQVETTLTKLESAYTMAEMYQELTGADVGISLAGVWRRGTNGYFYKGDITDKSLSCVTPAKESATEDKPMSGMIVTASMTGAQILDILNNADGPIDSSMSGAYYVASGLTVRFDPWAAEGSRVLSCKTPDGNEIDPDAVYEVAYYYDSLPDGSPEAESSLGEPWLDSFLKWLDQQGGVIKVPEMTIELAYGEAE